MYFSGRGKKSFISDYYESKFCIAVIEIIVKSVCLKANYKKS